MQKPLSRLADIYYGKSPADVLEDDGYFPLMGTGGEYGRTNQANFKAGIVVPRKGSLGSPHLVEGSFWASDTTYAVIPKEHVDVRWLYYSLLNFDLTRLNEATGVPSISREWLSKIKFSDPGQDRREKVADVLQAADQAIEKTEALIEKYQQIKSGLMHDLFTRGIGADGKLRPPREQAPELYQETPIGWIPKDWSIELLEAYLDGSSGLKPGPFGSSIKKESYVESGYKVYGQEQVISGDQGLGDYFINRSKYLSLEAFSVKDKDLLVSLVGTIGKVLVLREPFAPGIINPRLMRIRADKAKVDVEFMKYLLVSDVVKRQLETLAGGGTMPVLNAKVVRRLRIPYLGNLGEQTEISARLDAISEYVHSERLMLNQLRRQKNGLMADLLSGNVEVLNV